MAKTATATKTKTGLSDSAREAAQRILERAARRILEEQQGDGASATEPEFEARGGTREEVA